MTFTYDLASIDADIVLISEVRLELGDAVSGSGVRPNGVNFTDEELQSWITAEADDVSAVVGRAARALANQWASSAVSKSAGPYSVNYGKISDVWAKRAAEFETESGTSETVETGMITYDIAAHGDDAEMTS